MMCSIISLGVPQQVPEEMMCICKTSMLNTLWTQSVRLNASVAPHLSEQALKQNTAEAKPTFHLKLPPFPKQATEWQSSVQVK